MELEGEGWGFVEAVASVSPAALRRYVAFELRRMREASGYTQTQVAKYMHCAQSRITHLEGQRNPPRLEFLEKLLRHYGCTEERVEHFAGLLEMANAKSWWSGIDQTGEPQQFDLHLGLEEGASRIESTVASDSAGGDSFVRSWRGAFGVTSHRVITCGAWSHAVDSGVWLTG